MSDPEADFEAAAKRLGREAPRLGPRGVPLSADGGLPSVRIKGPAHASKAGSVSSRAGDQDISAAPAAGPKLPSSDARPLQAEAQTGEARFAGPIPARMLNEFVYCPRLFYYEFVEGVFLENADVIRGRALHSRVDRGKGDLPAAEGSKPAAKGAEDGSAKERAGEGEPETIHSRSVSLGSERLGVTAKIDIVELYRERKEGDREQELFIYKASPVDYKAGAPKKGEEGNQLWDADRMQLGLQALILRENGYPCDEAIVYYRATKQRVRLAITPELEDWIARAVEEARRVAMGPMPPPLVDSPKCVRCSLAPVCLPDETQFLAAIEPPGADLEAPPSESAAPPVPPDKAPRRIRPPRRLLAARDDRRALYLNTPGLRLGRRDETLVVYQDRKPIDEVRINDLTHVALFGNIQISTQAVQALCAAQVPIAYFSGGGWFYGITRGHELKNVFLRIEQFRRAAQTDFPLAMARRFVYGKIRNQRTLLMRNHIEPPPSALRRLKRAAEEALQASDPESLLGVEGAASNVYFEHFAGMIKADSGEGADLHDPRTEFTFRFAARNRRPPVDPVNALLSLGYSLLAKDCAIAALAVGFDPYVGFYHRPRFGRPALALDLMEEFRPLIAESAALTAINNRVIALKDFVRAGKAVNLSPAGRKKFFHVYEQRMNTLLTHPVFDYKVSYRRALELQARLLAKTLTGEIHAYIPLMTR